MGHVGALMSTGETRGVEPRLRIAERWMEALRAEPAGRLPAGLFVADPAELPKLPGLIGVHRCGLALMAGDVEKTMVHGREAIAVLDADDNLGQASVTALMGIASWRLGDLATAEKAYAESMRRLGMEGYVADVLGCAITLADLQVTQGRLRDAERTYREALDLAARQPPGPLRGTPDMHVGLSMIQHERGDLAAATEHLRLGHELGDHLGMPRYPHRWRIAEARVREAEGDLDDALRLLDEAEHVYDGDFSPDVQPVAAMRARVWVRQGRSERALAWAADRGLSPDDEPEYLREYEHITLARALVARGDSAAEAFLGRLLSAAEAGGRFGSVLEILVLRAIALQHRGYLEAAVATVADALGMAEPEGYVRTFADEGPPLATLLRAAAKRGVTTAYVVRLLGSPSPGALERTARSDVLIDPLSERELDVLRLLATELNGPEIARHLVVSLNTVRTHTKSIYAKLGVGSRRAAVLRAEQLGLLARPSA
jgi:LuxR family maltose regulon positive regulatory protein